MWNRSNMYTDLFCPFMLWFNLSCLLVSYGALAYILLAASYQIRKLAGCACAGNAGSVFPATDFSWLAIPACITARASRTCRDGKNVPGIPGACATCSCVSGKRPMAPGNHILAAVLVRYYQRTSGISHGIKLQNCDICLKIIPCILPTNVMLSI